VVLTWASTSHAGVVVVNIAAMCETVVPVLILFYRQGGEGAWSLMSSVAAAITTTIAAAVAAATAAVATAIHVAAAATAMVAATANVVAATATAATTASAAIVATTLLAAAASTPWALWLLLWGLAGADCLAEHLKLPLNCQDVGSVQS
jgi:hypothetical protein